MKAGSAQKMILNMLSTATMIRLGKVYGNLMVDVKVSNDKLLRRATRLVAAAGRRGRSARAGNLLEARRPFEVKTAVVMQRRGVDADAARHLLRIAEDKLRDCHRRYRLKAPHFAFPIDRVRLVEHSAFTALRKSALRKSCACAHASMFSPRGLSTISLMTRLA